MTLLVCDNQGQGARLAGDVLIDNTPGCVVGIGLIGGTDSVLRALTRAGRSLEAARATCPIEGVPDTWSTTRVRRLLEDLCAPDLDPPAMQTLGRMDVPAEHGFPRFDTVLVALGSSGELGVHQRGTPLRSGPRRMNDVGFLDPTDRLALKLSGESSGSDVVACGLAAVLEASTVIVVAFGSSRRDALAQAMEGPVSTACPASVLQLHANCVFIADTPAAAGLTFVKPSTFVPTHGL